jgi:hypothetical protein
VIDTSRLGPSTPLRVEEIRGLINRLRRAQIHASVDPADPSYCDLVELITTLQRMHKRKTGVQY